MRLRIKTFVKLNEGFKFCPGIRESDYGCALHSVQKLRKVQLTPFVRIRSCPSEGKNFLTFLSLAPQHGVPPVRDWPKCYRHLDDAIRAEIASWPGTALGALIDAAKAMVRKDIGSVTLIRLPQRGDGLADGWSCFGKCYLLNRVWAWLLFAAGRYRLLNGVTNAFQR